MLSNNKVPYFVCTMLLVSTNLSANEINNQSQINFDQAIKQTLTHNLELEGYRYKLNSHQYQIKHSGLSPSPEVELKVEDAYGSGRFSEFDNAQVSLNISWVVEGDLREAIVEYEKTGILKIDNDLIIKKLNISAQTARYYITSLAFQAQLENAIAAMRHAKDVISEVKKRLRAGRTTQAELVRAQAQLAHRELEVDDIKHEMESAYYQLASQWGKQKPDFKRALGTVYSIPKIKTLEKIILDLNKSPALKKLSLHRQEKLAQLDIEKEKSSSNWKVNLGVRSSQATDDQSIIAGISIPFGERSRNKYKIAQVKQELLEVESNTNAQIQKLRTNLFVLYEEFKHHQHQIDAHQNKIIPLLEKALVQAKRAYHLGRYSYLDWSSVQQELIKAKQKLLVASAEAQLKIIDIQRISGISIKLNKNF